MGVQGPIVDLVLLTLLVFFFAFEQRRRPEIYFRFWLVGWIITLFSVLCWQVTFTNATLVRIEKSFQQDAWCCAALTFVFSFLVRDGRWRGPLGAALSIAVPMCLGIDLIIFGAAPNALLYSLIAVCETLAVWAAYRFLPREHKSLFPAMTALCTGSGILLVAVVYSGYPQDVIRFVLLEIYAASALLYLRSEFKGGKVAGALGFLAWGGLFALTTHIHRNPSFVLAISAIWTIPKYVVGIAMIQTIFSETEKEMVKLGARYRDLYEEYRVLFSSNPHPMWIYDSSSIRFLAVNDSAFLVYGFTESEFLGMSVRDIEVVERGGVAVAEGRQGLKRATKHRRADGTTLDVDVTEHDMVFEGDPARFMLAVDTTERELLHRELLRQARHDVLTGLPNRSMLDDRIEQCLSRCMREDKKGAVLTVDIDHFKRVNDTHGHLVGDECLKAVAARLSSRVRQVDTIARTGGEEFTIVLGGLSNRAAAEKVCAEMLKLFNTPMTCGDCELAVTVSIGGALFPDDAIDIEGLRRRSDQALYEAKRSGRNRVVFASPVSV